MTYMNIPGLKRWSKTKIWNGLSRKQRIDYFYTQVPTFNILSWTALEIKTLAKKFSYYRKGTIAGTEERSGRGKDIGRL